MSARRPLWELIRNAAEELDREGRVPFTRRDLAERIRRDHPEVKDSSLNPMIQGVTANLKGGAPGGVGKEILRSVGRGLFELNRKAEKVIQERVSQLRTMDVMSATLGRAGEVERFYVSYETDLQRFLERNPSAIENGLELVEREVDVEAGGRIDLLCKDTENTLVVVELKVGTADDRTLGQLQRYIGWVTRKKATPGQRVRGIIVAETFDESLRYSTLGTTTKTLRYRIDVSCQEAWSADK